MYTTSVSVSAGYMVVNCAIIVLTVGVHHVAKGLGFFLITFGIGNITSQSVGGMNSLYMVYVLICTVSYGYHAAMFYFRRIIVQHFWNTGDDIRMFRYSTAPGRMLVDLVLNLVQQIQKNATAQELSARCYCVIRSAKVAHIKLCSL